MASANHAQPAASARARPEAAHSLPEPLIISASVARLRARRRSNATSDASWKLNTLGMALEVMQDSSRGVDARQSRQA